MATSWKPEDEGLIELEQLFPADLNNYLVSILSRSEVFLFLLLLLLLLLHLWLLGYGF
ncbi:hypothetical protein LguiA_008476 [Lonicera macranthoides]